MPCTHVVYVHVDVAVDIDGDLNLDG